MTLPRHERETLMFDTRVLIIGAGQAGLAVSKLLTDAGVDHVILERGRTAERWTSQRWDSLRLLTPNWMSRLPGWSYRGTDPSGFMPAVEVAEYLTAYAASFGSPIIHGVEVRSVRLRGSHYRVTTDAGIWSAAAVVIATGYGDRSAVPLVAGDLDPSIRQITPDLYRNPGDVPDGRVLVVGALPPRSSRKTSGATRHGRDPDPTRRRRSHRRFRAWDD